MKVERQANKLEDAFLNTYPWNGTGIKNTRRTVISEKATDSPVGEVARVDRLFRGEDRQSPYLREKVLSVTGGHGDTN